MRHALQYYRVMMFYISDSGTCNCNYFPSIVYCLCLYMCFVVVVSSCPLTKFEGGLNLLHEADDDAVIWLESTATAALAK